MSNYGKIDILMTYSYNYEQPDVSAFVEFREKCGWGRLDEETAQRTLTVGKVNVCAFDGAKLIGFGRIIGDGAIYFYVQDLIVLESYQWQGIGEAILTRLLSKTRKIAATGAIVGLMSTVGTEPFYKRHGFVARPNDKLGAGMMLSL